MNATEEAKPKDAGEVVSGNWYKPGPSIQEFHQYAPPVLEGGYDVRVLIGGRASGKTTGLAVDVIGHCNAFAGAKFIGLRRTQVSNDDTSVRTFNDVYAMCGYRASLEEDTSLFRKWDDGLTVRIPSVAAVTAYNEFCSVRRTKAEIRTWIANEGDRLCSYILFRGMKDAQKTQGQLRGFECSYIAMIEADEMDENVVDLGVACFRWKDAYGKPFHRYRLVLDTNPPGKRHWIALTEKEVLKGKKPGWKYWHLRTEENKQNLAPGFIEGLENQYASKPAHRRRYLLGEYADLYNGEPVYHEFKEDVHKAENLPFPKGAYLVRGWDFGSTNTVVWGAYFKIDYDIGGKTVPVEYWWDLFERYAEMSDIDRQCAEAIAITDREFPFHNDRNICSGVLDFCDPAGAQRGDKGSSIEVMAAHGLFPRYQTRIRSLDTTIAIYNRLLKMRDPLGRPCYQIDPVTCPRLTSALAGEYRYPFQGEGGYLTGEPIKGPAANGADHIADAARYPKINLMRLATKMMDEVAKANSGPLGSTRKLNPAKRWW